MQNVCMLVVGLLAVNCERGEGAVEGAVEVEGIDKAVVPEKNSDSGSCTLLPLIVAW